MKNTILLLLVVVGASIFAAPADNFKKAGVSLGGSFSFYKNDEDFLKDEAHKNSYMNLSLSPNFGIFVVDNISAYISPKLTYISTDTYNSYTEDYTTGRTLDLSMDLGFTYYYTDMGNIVPLGGLYTGFRHGRTLPGDDNGEATDLKRSSFYFNYGLEAGFLYFLTNNVALRFSGDINISGSKNLTDYKGDKVVYSDDYVASDELDMSTYIYVGVNVFFPKDESKIIISK